MDQSYLKALRPDFLTLWNFKGQQKV